MLLEDSDAWKVSAQLASNLYEATRDLKDWGFRDQITRAGLSISSNIAERLEHESIVGCIRFLGIAKGSAAEVCSQLYIGKDIGYIDKEPGQEWLQSTERIAGMLTSLITKKREFATKVGRRPPPLPFPLARSPMYHC
jgi:four helix bundle protein